MSGAPIKFGVLHDAPRIDPRNPALRAMTLRVEECNAAGGIEGRQVELVFHAGNGAHDGLPENCAAGWRHLAAMPEVVGILGPGITDNVLAVGDAVEAGRVATIQWSGDERARGEWLFHFQAGSLQEEGPYLARLMKRLGHRTVGVLQTGGPVGDGFYGGFEQSARDLGLEIVSRQFAHVHATDVRPEMERLRRASPDCVVFLGMAEPTIAFGRAIKAMGWKVPRYSNIAMLAVARDPKDAADNEGIIWTDQYDPRNETLQRVRAAFTKRYGEPPPETFTASFGYDMMTLMLEGLRLAPSMTRSGLKTGLERVKQLPCATGGRNPIMGFAPWDRAAIKGPDLLIYRTVRNGKCVTFEG